MLVLPVISLLSAVYFYIQALKNAMGAKRWCLLGLLLGPLLLPMFNTHKRLLGLRASNCASPSPDSFHA